MSRYQGRRPEDADYGLGEHSIDCDELGILDEAALTTKLVRAFESPGYRPPRLPAVATELLALSRQGEVEFAAVESLLARDPVLAGEVLSMAQSAFYARTVPVDSLHDALVRLGLGKLRDIVLQAAMNLRVFRSNAHRDSMERLRLHCHAMAHLSQIVAQHTSRGGERAFLCGLLHDVGFAGILLVLSDTERGRTAPDLSAAWPSIDAAHARAGGRMVGLWQLPEEIATAVRAHHQIMVEGACHPLAAIVCVAESLAAELGLAFDPTAADARSASSKPDDLDRLVRRPFDRSDEATVRRAREALGLTDPLLEVVRESAGEWAAAAGVLRIGGARGPKPAPLPGRR